MIEPHVVERVSAFVADSLRAELIELERRNDELHRRLRELLAERGGEYLAELQTDYDDLVELADQAISERETFRSYALALEAQLKASKQSPQVKRPDTIGGTDGS